MEKNNHKAMVALAKLIAVADIITTLNGDDIESLIDKVFYEEEGDKDETNS